MTTRLWFPRRNSATTVRWPVPFAPLSVTRRCGHVRHDGCMPRPPRHVAPDVVYHAIGRGCRGQPIFETLSDKQHFVYLLARVAEEFEWRIFNWVLMTNHHHLVVHLSKPNLASGMQQLHGLFGQRWNERHESSGHVFFRRYTSIPVLKWEYAATLTTYLDLNPVRVGLCLQAAASSPSHRRGVRALGSGAAANPRSACVGGGYAGPVVATIVVVPASAKVARSASAACPSGEASPASRSATDA